MAADVGDVDVGDVGDVRVRDVEDVRDVRDVRVRDVVADQAWPETFQTRLADVKVLAD